MDSYLLDTHVQPGTSEKEKRAMFVGDFFVLVYAHWRESLTMQPTRQQARADIIDSEAGAPQLKRSASRVLDDTLQVLQGHVCLCGRDFKRKFTLDRHLEIHVKAGGFAKPFRVVDCMTILSVSHTPGINRI